MHDGLGAKESLISRRTAKEDHLGPYQEELFCQKRLAAMDLFGCRAPVLGRPALGDIADMVVIIGKAVASQKVLEELAGPAYKGKSLDILVLAWSLADDHQRSLPAAPVYNNIRSTRSEAAVIAGLASGFKRFPFLIKFVCHINLLLEHDHGNTVVLKSPVPVA